MIAELICQQCGRAFLRQSWDVKRREAKYCSFGCFNEARKGKPRLEMRRRITKVCLRCGNEFETGGRAGKVTKIYCSNRCSKMTRNGSTMANGYRCIRLNGKRIYEHRLIVEQTLGRLLRKDEVVHHNNFNKIDNRPENLTVMSQKTHRSLIDYLAGLWVKEHPGMVDKITREYASGGYNKLGKAAQSGISLGLSHIWKWSSYVC